MADQHLLFSMDYGTKKLRIGVSVLEKGQIPTLGDIDDVPFENAAFAPQKLAFKNGECFWGKRVEYLLETPDPERPGGKIIEPEDVVHFLKICNYTSAEAEDLAEDTFDVLDQKEVKISLGLAPDASVHDVKVHALAEHLRGIKDHVWEWIQKQSTLQSKYKGIAEKLDTMPSTCIFTIPSMWLPSGNRFITAAAKIAGIDNIVLVHEAQAAAAYYLHKSSQENTKTISKGQGILVLDGGGATSDISVYRLQEDSTSGASTKMQPVGDPMGQLCGSEFVNHGFLKWLDERLDNDEQTYPGGTIKMLQELGITPANLRAQADKQFSVYKEEFWGQQDKEYDVHINGKKGAKKRSILITMNSEDMKGFFAPVLQKNFEMMDECLAKYKWIGRLVTVGGLFNSEYVSKAFRQRYANHPADNQDGKLWIENGTDPVTYNHPVARGALLRHYALKPRDLPDTDSFLIGQDWPRDAIEDGPESKSPFTLVQGEANATKTWVKSLSKTIVPAGERDMKTTIWHERIVRRDQETLELQLFWSPKACKEDTAIFRKDTDETVRGIERFGPALELKLPGMERLQQRGVELKIPDELDQRENPLAEPDDDNPEDRSYRGSHARSSSQPGRSTRKRQRTVKLVCCENCGVQYDAAMASGSVDQICEDCVNKTFYTIMCRVTVNISGVQHLLKVEMAWPDKFDKAQKGEELGDDDVFLMYEDTIAESSRNHHALE